MKKTQLYVIIFILLLPSISLAQEDTWTRKADMPTPRSYFDASVVSGKIYVMGGVAPGMPTVEEYDPMTDTWTRKADMPTPSNSFATSAVNGKIYAIGISGSKLLFSIGLEQQTDLDNMKITDGLRQEFENNGISLSQNIPVLIYRSRGSLWLINDIDNEKVYYVERTGDKLDIYIFSSSEVQEYDPVTDTWTKKADMPTKSDQLIAAAVNGYIYAIGGVNRQATVEAYDTGFGGFGIRVTTISPQEGRITGGEAFAIFGKGFPANAIVTIGENPLTDLKVTDTLITGLTPPGTEGKWDVEITTPELDYSVLAEKFFYNPLSNIVVRAMTPINGKQAGGDAGSITGSGFQPGATVNIGGIEATNVVVTSTLITFTIPPGTEGTKDVVVTNPDGQKGTLRDGYTYNPFPIIEEIQPDFSGPLKGGTPIIITGNYFMDGVVVTIGDERV